MSIDVEYAIRKDIRNNPIIRQVDTQQKREFLTTSVLAGVIMAMGIFAAWQHFQIVKTGYDTQKLQDTRAAEETLNRRLRLEVETLRAPQRIEQLALRKLHMTAPLAKDTIVVERATPTAPDQAIVAAVR